MGFARAATVAQIEHAKVESTHERKDRAWRRWLQFCEEFYVVGDTYLLGLGNNIRAKIFLISCFLSAFRT